MAALSRTVLLVVLLLPVFHSSFSLWALDAGDIPTDAPQDAVMASVEEIRQMQDWAAWVFTGRKPAGREAAIGVELRRQDHSTLGFGQSCIDTPIRLGQREFKHGLGTHANSEIRLHLPPGATEFQAMAGIDNNADTEGIRGSVQFSVVIGEREVFRTPTLRGTNEPVAVKVPLPEGARELVLRVDTTADGPAHDQANWADARILTADGRTLWVDDDRPPMVAASTPFSFRCGGVESRTFLDAWRHEATTRETATRRVHEASWTDPASGLCARVEVTAFKRYPAVEWVLYFENRGQQDSPPIEDICALDVQVRTGYFRKPVVLHQLVGDVCGERSFLPFETVVEPGKTQVLAPAGGRSSNGAFPFFNLAYGDAGLIVAVGWSGQWQARIHRTDTGPTRLSAGMEKAALRLHPGEKIPGPRSLILPWAGDRLAAHNRFRRLMLFEYAPRVDGRPVVVPIALQCFDRYVARRLDWGTETAQIQAARAARDLGCDTHWLDAAWFEGGFPNGVGNWFCPADRFPRGLKPLGEACHAMGLNFLLWFEPERVASGSQIAREHPEYVLGGAGGGLFNLGDPAARLWLTDLLSRRITEYGIDVYRNDFNLDPLEYWRRADAPDRQGMAEIRYVEGHYTLWDELLRQHPGLRIDNCASGGRRIDIETCRRSVPLWHSDTGCSPGHADWNQTHLSGLSLYLPLFAACAWTPDAYEVRSAASAGVICQFGFLDEGFSTAAARAALEEVKRNQKFWYGDFYPLSECQLGPKALVAYQLHRADLNAGLVMAFRRSGCPYPVLQGGLRGLDAGTDYQLEFIDDARSSERRVVPGKELLTDFELRLPKRGSSLLIRYSPTK